MRFPPQTPESIDEMFGGMSVDEMHFSFDNHLFDASMLSMDASSDSCSITRGRRQDDVVVMSAESSDSAVPSPMIGVCGLLDAESEEWLSWLRAFIPVLDGLSSTSGQSISYQPAFIPKLGGLWATCAGDVGFDRKRRVPQLPDSVTSSESVEFLFWCWTWSRYDRAEMNWTVEPRMEQIDSWEIR